MLRLTVLDPKAHLNGGNMAITHSSVCPHCKQPLSSLQIEKVKIYDGISHVLTGMTLACPGCHNVLNVGFDYTSTKEDIAATVVKWLKG